MINRAYPAAVLILCSAGALAQAPASRTPPISPKVQETPLPPAVVLPVPAAPSGENTDRPLGPEEAVAIALRRQPSIDSARAAILSAQGRTGQARAGLMPDLGVTAGISRTERLASTGGSTARITSTGVQASDFQAGATLRQLLFNFNHTRDLVSQTRLQESVAAANLSRAQSDLALQVKQAFYTLLQNSRLIGVNESNVRNQQEHLGLAQARLNAGLGIPLDVARAQTAVADAILNLNLARNAAAIARVNLAALMGIDPRTPLSPAPVEEPAPPSLDVPALVESALRQRPEMASAEANRRSARYGVRAAKTTNAPAVSATVGLGARGNDFPPGSDTLNVGLSLQFDPFDGGLTRGRVREAQGGLQAAEAQLASVRLTVVSDVSQAYLNLQTAQQRVATAGIEVANAGESVRLATGRYRSGLGTFIEVTDAQTLLLTAQTNEVNAISAVNQARAALARALGAAPLRRP